MIPFFFSFYVFSHGRHTLRQWECYTNRHRNRVGRRLTVLMYICGTNHLCYSSVEHWANPFCVCGMWH
ncbi:hypothetical protein BS78_04G232700 [Paspalum vaginatum]|nr:hypothetical protein BS78_04G232700 [Paspalum vaginatum]KAJ1280441.1 hypothetical protein BS78_04G232700 [Paspalum vaginatum]